MLFFLEQLIRLLTVNTLGAAAGFAVAILCIPLVRPLHRLAARWTDRLLPAGKETALDRAFRHAIGVMPTRRQLEMRRAAERALKATGSATRRPPDPGSKRPR